MLCGEPAESSYGLAYQAVLEGSEACVEIPQRHILVWIVVIQKNDVLINLEMKDKMTEAKTTITSLDSTLTPSAQC